jgi:hypothetical protein
MWKLIKSILIKDLRNAGLRLTPPSFTIPNLFIGKLSKKVVFQENYFQKNLFFNEKLSEICLENKYVNQQ